MPSPYQTVILNQPPPAGVHQMMQPQATIMTSQQPPTQPPQHAIVQHHQLGMNYAQNAAPGPVHVFTSSAMPTLVGGHPSTYYTAQGQPLPQAAIMQAAPTHSLAAAATAPVAHAPAAFSQSDASRLIVASPSRPEPLFIPPPNSVKVKHVLHSEAYVR